FNVDRPIEYVSSRPFIRHFLVDISQTLLYLIRRESRFFKSGGTVGNQRVESDGVSRMNAQHRLRGRVVVAPGHSLRRSGQRVRMWSASGHGRLLRNCGRNGREQKNED